MYKVIWLDDEHENFQSIKDEALLENVRLIGYTNANDGGLELSKNHSNYDAVILDGLFLRTEESDISNVAFGDVAKILVALKSKGILMPWFIFSGQPSFVKDKNTLVEIFKGDASANGKVFDKNNDEDFVKLLNEIKTAADHNPVRTLKMESPEAFLPFDLNIIDRSFEPILIEILFALQNKDYTKKNLNVQRDLLEAIYRTLNNPIPCIHDSFFDNAKNDKPNLEWCTRFLEDREVNGQKLNKPVPQSIKSALRKLKESTSEYSHLSEETIIKLPFLSNTFLLMEILEWLPDFVQRHYKNYI